MDSWAGVPERQLAQDWCRYRRGRSVGAEAQAPRQYQASAAYQSAPRSDFNQAPPQVLVTAPPAAATAPPAAVTAPPAVATAPPERLSSQKNGKPVVGVTFPSDWKQVTGDRYISAVSADGQAYAMIAPLEGAADKPGGINRVKQGLLQYLQDIKYDDLTETKRGALVVTGTAKGKKAGVDVVFAAGVLDARRRANRRGRIRRRFQLRTTIKKRSARSARRFASGTISRRRNRIT